MSVSRFDVGELRKPTKTSQGFLRAEGRLTRCGIFEYVNADGTSRRELRHPEEVFNADSLASLADAPVTFQHPSDPVDAENAGAHARGHLAGKPTRDGDFVRAELVITHADAIRALEGRQARQLSCGYSCDLEETPGLWQGERYDSVQRGIRYNHVAIVPVGRAGAACAVRMDSKKGFSMATVRIDGVDHDVDDAVSRYISALEADRDSKRSVARADSDFRAAVRSRCSLERVAAEFLGNDRFDSMSDNQVRVALIQTLSRTVIPRERLDDETYLVSRMAAELDGRGAASLAALRVTGEMATLRGGERLDGAAKYRKDINDLWKQPIEGAFTREDAAKALSR